ncbi:MAG: tetratricopeptide repeat protein [Clostridia bacterium]|nr:tetratricopeptide repeat protein [Clostridia bacterium]
MWKLLFAVVTAGLLIYFLWKRMPYILYINKASKKMDEKNYSEALIYFRKGAKFNSVSPMVKISYAFNELKYGDIKTAKKQLMMIISDRNIKQNFRYEAKAIYALVLLVEGDIPEAKETLMEVYENYKNTNIYCSLGYLINVSDDYETALKFNLEAYDYNGDKEVIMDNLGQCYYLGKEYDKAEEIYVKLMEKEPKFPEAYYNYGLVLKEKGRKDEAVKMFKKALECPFNRLSTVTSKEVEEALENC